MLDEDYFNIRDRLIEDGFIEANPKRWVRHKKEEVYDYFHLKLYPNLKGPSSILSISEKFYDYWDGLDWKVRNTRIKSWKGRANTWIKNNEKYKRSNGNGLASYDNNSTDWS